ncbi:MAG: hypothetical protein ACRDJE_13395 [Dehalococcoidia bacterium]
MTADRSELLRFCRVALEQVARAERFTMAEWLAVRLDGRTVKAAYAEAARLAWEMSTDTSIVAPGSAGVAPAGSVQLDRARSGQDARAPRDRERRPVLVVMRELRECLERVTASMERGEPLAAAVEEKLTAVEALMSPDR